MNSILDSIVPCGLNCSKCFAHIGGAIQTLSKELQKNLGDFDIYAKRFAELINEPIFEDYPSFKKMLDYFAQGNCMECRNEQCKLFKQCGVRACQQEKKVTFCFECNDFPCEKTNFDTHLQNRWLRINERIREVGIINYYEETEDKPRY